MGSVQFGQNTTVVRREGGDGGAGNIEHQWRCRLLGKNGIWSENVPHQTVLTHSSNHRWTWTNRIRDPQNVRLFLVKL